MKSLYYYNELVKRIDAFTSDVTDVYGTLLQCREGCSECCILESVFPVEMVVILDWYSMQSPSIREAIANNNDSEYCIFLHEHSCRIYPYRPIICRTHGYPIMVDATIDVCPCNNGIQFAAHHILNVEHCNSMLAGINLLFIKEVNIPLLQKERIDLRTFFQSSESDILSIVHSLKR